MPLPCLKMIREKWRTWKHNLMPETGETEMIRSFWNLTDASAAIFPNSHFRASVNLPGPQSDGVVSTNMQQGIISLKTWDNINWDNLSIHWQLLKCQDLNHNELLHMPLELSCHGMSKLSLWIFLFYILSTISWSGCYRDNDPAGQMTSADTNRDLELDVAQYQMWSSTTTIRMSPCTSYGPDALATSLLARRNHGSSFILREDVLNTPQSPQAHHKQHS